MNHFTRTAGIGLAVLTLSLSAWAGGRPSFPMQPNVYKPVLQERIEAVWRVILHKLDGHAVSPERKKQIRGMLDASAKDVWAAYGKAAADGSISREEADRLRDAARGLRARVRENMAVERRSARTTAMGEAAPKVAPSATGHHATAPPSTSVPARASAAPKHEVPAGQKARSATRSTPPSVQTPPRSNKRPARAAGSPPRPPGADESGE